ncbi:MAG: SDR family oxidoreductase [Gemmobacter sp.]
MPGAVLLTGVSGFIARHIALRLLDSGHAVRGSLRDPARGDELRAALRPHLADPSNVERLSFVALDLEDDAGWAEAAEGVDAVIHTASPFPMSDPKDPQAVIRPAVEGTLRALRAANGSGVGRVILTSSIVAVMRSALPEQRSIRDEDDWSDPEMPGITPYEISKTLAERAAWDFVAEEGQALSLTTILPGFVMGPPIGSDAGTSIGTIRRILSGRDPLQPRIGFPVVDVRDVALAHLRALEREETAGKRVIVAERFLWFHDMASILKAAHPERRIGTRVAPDWMIRLLGLFDAEVRTITPALGKRIEVSNQRARDLLGIDFLPADEAVRQTAASLVGTGRA